MASRSGGAPIRTKKVRSGPDQTFTLQKGVSAAPLKGPGMGVRKPLGKKTKKPLGKKTKKQLGIGTIKRTANKVSTFLDRKKQMGQLKKGQPPFTAKEMAIAAAYYSLGATGGGKKAEKKSNTKGKTLSQVEAKARKARDRKARYERLKKDPRRS